MNEFHSYWKGVSTDASIPVGMTIPILQDGVLFLAHFKETAILYFILFYFILFYLILFYFIFVSFISIYLILFYLLFVFLLNDSIIHLSSLFIRNCGIPTNRKQNYKHVSVLPFIFVSCSLTIEEVGRHSFPLK